MKKPTLPPAYRYPMKPTLIYHGEYLDRLLGDAGWVIERKYDGCRSMVYALDDRVEIWDRHANLVPEEVVPDIYAAVRALNLPAGIALDGEIYPRGVMTTKHPAPGKFQLALFDVMTSGLLRARQKSLRALVRAGTVAHYVEQATMRKPSFLARIWGDTESEGVVLKRLDSVRLDDPKTTRISPYWVKLLKPTLARA